MYKVQYILRELTKVHKIKSKDGKNRVNLFSVGTYSLLAREELL